MSSLEILNGKAGGKTVDLEQFAGQEKITLGNRRTASVVIKDPWVSFMHAVITHDGTRYRIADKRSKAGTFVNGNKIGPTGTPLKDGDTIALGRTELRFRDGCAPVPTSGRDAAAGPFTPTSASSPREGPFTPHAADPAAGPSAEAERLEADLRALRTAVAQREKALAEANARLRELEAGGGDPDLARRLREAEGQLRRLQQQLADTTAKGKVRIEELTRLNHALEARLAQGGAGDVAQLERELARLREEGRVRIEQLARELAEAKAQAEGASPPTDSEAEARAQEAEERARAAEERARAAEERARAAEEGLESLKADFGALQAQKTDLELKVQDLEEGLGSLGSGGDEVAAMEEVIAQLNAELRAAREEATRLRAERERAREASTPSAPPAAGAEDSARAQEAEARAQE
ncbi:MAG: FHA domain-containing protein, partial [Planctomycetota bacterium]